MTVDGFVVGEAFGCLCSRHGKSNVHSLTPSSRVLHHIVSFCLVPQGDHRDEVSYLEAFLVDSILLGRCVNVDSIIMNHMAACCQNNTLILPCWCIMTKVLRAFGIDLTLESNVEDPSPYDAYNDQSTMMPLSLIS